MIGAAYDMKSGKHFSSIPSKLAYNIAIVRRKYSIYIEKFFWLAHEDRCVEERLTKLERLGRLYHRGHSGRHDLRCDVAIFLGHR